MYLVIILELLIVLKLFNLIGSYHNWNTVSGPIFIFLLLLWFVGVGILVLRGLGELVEDDLSHNDRVPSVRNLILLNRHNLLFRRRLHDFNGLSDKFALAELVPRVMFHKAFQVVLDLEKLGTHGASKAV